MSWPSRPHHVHKLCMFTANRNCMPVYQTQHKQYTTRTHLSDHQRCIHSFVNNHMLWLILLHLLLSDPWNLLSSMTHTHTHTHHNHFTALFPGPSGWASAKRKLLDFLVQGRFTEADISTIRLGATPSGLTSAHLHHPPIFYRPDAFPAAQPTVPKRWRQLAHSD